MIKISASFDGGNILVHASDNPDDIQLEIRKDHQSDFYQWFYFRVSGAKDTPCHYRILNAASAAYPAGWKDYQAVASIDRINWFRVPTNYDGKVLSINHTPQSDIIYYAYFAPYSMERHADLISKTLLCVGTSLNVIGSTLDGQDLDVLTIADPLAPDNPQEKHQLWITARQHPGETMAQWWMEGFLERLTDISDPIARTLKQKATFHIVPNMNPDGSRRGHLRTNAAGANLNREWSSPSLERSPEVYNVVAKMQQTGVDFALDVHGDEALPYNFIAGAEGVPSFTQHGEDLLNRYKEALKVASPDFQTVYGYPRNPPGTANMGICANYLAETFDCLAMTLEMPFKDTVETPDHTHGWSPDRCKKMGAANLDAMLAVIDHLRA